ncbi:acyltransferase family protein [uncultured Ralstonia sp.]|jgi:surface polysaccharide O-acyltransferase-like enzyme|uniref:acyltransferase n=1 Tax=Ralstonia sp. TaxID=54061 RepID=UPI001EAADCA4|nr:acyltransferase family protein [uncultured Ralstonia sp.]UCF23769.1 MAG: acyltransferase family protein [Ralstonia sp.]
MNESISNKIHWMRAIGCVGVISLHSAIIDNLVNPSWWSSNIFGGIARFAVPMFFMISGCLLINERYRFDGFVKRRLLRIVPAIIFWDAVYYAWLTHGSGSIPDFFVASVEGPIYYPLWYLYALVGTYLALIVIIPFYNHSSEKEKTFFVALWAICYGALPVATDLYKLPSTLVGTYSLGMFAEPIGWLVLGAMLRDAAANGKHQPNARIAFLASLWCLAVILVLTKLYTFRTADSLPPRFVAEAFRTPQSIFTIAYSVCVFLFFLGIQTQKHPRIEKLVEVISECSLGIYCLHVLVMTEVLSRLKHHIASSWIVIPTVTGVTFLICLAASYGARKVKLARYVF